MQGKCALQNSGEKKHQSDSPGAKLEESAVGKATQVEKGYREKIRERDSRRW